MSTSAFPIRTLFLLAFVLVALGALAARLTPRPSPSLTEQTEASTVPDLTSAAFPEGDALAGLGADWTYLRQTAFQDRSSAAMPGTSSTRQSVIKAVGKETQLLLEEANIIDRVRLDVALKEQEVAKTEVAGRGGYLVPTADLAGGTGLLLVGTSTTLLIQDATSAAWPRTVLPEVLSYIATVRVR